MNIEQIKLLVKGALSKDASVNFEDGQNAAASL